MFPLLNKDKPNPLELFQIWLNLPASRKFANPYYNMLWAEDIPTYTAKDSQGKHTYITLVAGKLGDVTAPSPAPDSWAAEPANEVGIWLIRMEPNAAWTIPAASPEIKRALYFYRGSDLKIAGMRINPYHSVDLLPDLPAILENGPTVIFLLMLQGCPINEPVVQHGPFVMNTPAEIQKAINDYRKTQFGGWPWNRHDNVYTHERGRFARYADGREEVR
jgi:hypothetical protein